MVSFALSLRVLFLFFCFLTSTYGVMFSSFLFFISNFSPLFYFCWCCICSIFKRIESHFKKEWMSLFIQVRTQHFTNHKHIGFVRIQKKWRSFEKCLATNSQHPLSTHILINVPTQKKKWTKVWCLPFLFDRPSTFWSCIFFVSFLNVNWPNTCSITSSIKSSTSEH